nr:hypothetical protein [Sporomusa ovata]
MLGDNDTFIGHLGAEQGYITAVGGRNGALVDDCADSAVPAGEFIFPGLKITVRQI